MNVDLFAGPRKVICRHFSDLTCILCFRSFVQLMQYAIIQHIGAAVDQMTVTESNSARL